MSFGKAAQALVCLNPSLYEAGAGAGTWAAFSRSRWCVLDRPRKRALFN